MSGWGTRFFGDQACKRHGEAACPSCLAYALQDARALLVEARERVREVEWSGWDGNDAFGGPCCVSCRTSPPGHASNCALAALLARLDEEVGP